MKTPRQKKEFAPRKVEHAATPEAIAKDRAEKAQAKAAQEQTEKK